MAAGGEPFFPSRMSSVEAFDVGSGGWAAWDGLPGYRSGCVGFFRRGEGDGEGEFWVMGGHGDCGPVEGVVAANVHYRDVFVLGLRSGKWREGGDMWEDGERRKLGQVAVVDGVDGEAVDVFMLDQDTIFRFFIQIFKCFFLRLCRMLMLVVLRINPTLPRRKILG